ncbi:MAG: nitrous oxide reductase accessory protein NosL [Desulfocapsa sp.]|nr:nitrous oxide reductase accessory protein NosL [Desulfocapsa sp.]
MKHHIYIVTACIIFLFASVHSAQTNGNTPDAGTRCPVCGMFVAKYPQWLATLTIETDNVLYFDGVKDMMAYFFAPEDFGGAAETGIAEVGVRDYYSQKWIDGKTAHFVLGSDVLGPMGYELIPFATEAAAQNFLKDHQGREILAFSEITPEHIDSMRKGHKMKMMKKK